MRSMEQGGVSRSSPVSGRRQGLRVCRGRPLLTFCVLGRGVRSAPGYLWLSRPRIRSRDRACALVGGVSQQNEDYVEYSRQVFTAHSRKSTTSSSQRGNDGRRWCVAFGRCLATTCARHPVLLERATSRPALRQIAHLARCFVPAACHPVVPWPYCQGGANDVGCAATGGCSRRAA